MYSKVRKMIKAGNSKLVVVKYSPKIFRIRTKKEPTGEKGFSNIKMHIKPRGQITGANRIKIK